VRSFQGDEDQGGRQRGHSQQLGSSRCANRGGRETAAAAVIPSIISPERTITGSSARDRRPDCAIPHPRKIGDLVSYQEIGKPAR